MALPPTCNVLGLVCFGNGLFKEGSEYYSPAMVRRIPENFRKLRGHTDPKIAAAPGAKLGHDSEQVFAGLLQNSMGFLSLGHVSDVREVPGHPGYIEVDIRGVPTRAVGGQISAGHIVGSSVELKPWVPEPSDPAKRIEGPILTGIAFLGHEQPAVRDWPPELRERAKPKATFDDGNPVPAMEPTPEHMAAMAATAEHLASKLGGEFSAERRVLRLGKREYAASVACFSDASEFAPPEPETKAMQPLTPEQIAALKAAGVSDDQIAACGGTPAPATAADATPPIPTPPPGAPATGVMGAAAEPSKKPDEMPFAAACKKFADDPAATPDQKMMAEMYSAFSSKFADLEKRAGAVEMAAEAEKKKDEEGKMAAFADRVNQVCKKLGRKFMPIVIEKVHRPTLMGILTTKTFASESDRMKTFNDMAAHLESAPDDHRIVSSTLPPLLKNPAAQITDQGRELLSSLAVTNPRVVERLTAHEK